MSSTVSPTSLSAGLSAHLCGPNGLASGAAPCRPIRRVLLLDGYSTRTLACVRSWGRRGIEFVVGGETRVDMSLFSRYTKQKCVYTSPKRDLSKFIAEVNAHCLHFDVDHIFPTSEAAIMACSDRESELVATPIIPRRGEIETAFSKIKTLRIAQSLGIPVPKTLYLTGADTRSYDAKVSGRGQVRIERNYAIGESRE